MAVYTAIDDPEAYFQTVIYTGNGSADHAITLPGDTDMQPDFVWIKNRDAADAHCLFDSVRGATIMLQSNDTSGEATDTDTLDAFQSDGFKVDGDNEVNTNAEDYVAWNWKESATAGFDIVAYTGTGSARTISHSLSAVPGVVLVKSRGGTYGWGMYHHKNTSAPETDYLSINGTDATVDDSVFWNDTAPTSSVFSLGTTDAINKNTVTHIAYLWSEVQGFSKFGSYTGNGNADGAFIYTGFRPAMVIFKQSSANGEKWYLFDSKRNPFNLANELLFPSDALAESVNTAGAPIDILSNGFKIRGTDAAGNASGSTYIYLAFAEAPFVNSEGVPCNAR